jgi:hypothetical protein
MDVSRAVQIMARQGADESKIARSAVSLTDAGMIPTDGISNASQLAAFLLGTASPETTVAAEFAMIYGRLTNSRGQSLSNCLTSELSKQPCDVSVQSIRISQNVKFATVKFLDGRQIDFGPEYETRAYQNQVYISGGLVSALAMKVHNI